MGASRRGYALSSQVDELLVSDLAGQSHCLIHESGSHWWEGLDRTRLNHVA